MVDQLEENFEKDAGFQRELDEFKTSLETNTKVSDELRDLYLNLVTNIADDLEHPETLSIHDVADLQKDLEQLKVSGVENKLALLGETIQGIEEKKFEDLPKEEQLDYIAKITNQKRKDRFIKKITDPQKELIAQEEFEKINGPVAAFYDGVGLGGVVRDLNERGMVA